MACRFVLAAFSLLVLAACASPNPMPAGPSRLEAGRVQPLPPPCQKEPIADSRDASDGRCRIKTASWHSPGGALEGAALASKFRLP